MCNLPTGTPTIVTWDITYICSVALGAELVMYADSVDNTAEENSSVFFLIQIRWLPSSRACQQENFAPTKSSS